MWKAYSKNNIINQNTNVEPEGASAMLIKNIGSCLATINDNIPLKPGDTFKFECDKDVVIDETTFVRFVGDEPDRFVLIVKQFFKLA